MRTIVSLLLVLAVLCALLVLEFRRGTIGSFFDVFNAPGFPPTPPALPRPKDGPQCLERLDQMEGVKIKKMDAFFNDEGCGAQYPVLVQSIAGIDIEGRGLTLTCTAAEHFAQWVQNDVRALIKEHDKQPLRRISHMGSYNCRRIGGSSVWSQHAFANAIDIEGLVFEDGTAITIKDDWNSEPILQDLATSACDDFNVVLSPNYNALHHDHLHFDLGPFRTCR